MRFLQSTYFCFLLTIIGCAAHDLAKLTMDELSALQEERLEQELVRFEERTATSANHRRRLEEHGENVASNKIQAAETSDIASEDGEVEGMTIRNRLTTQNSMNGISDKEYIPKQSFNLNNNNNQRLYDIDHPTSGRQEEVLMPVVNYPHLHGNGGHWSQGSLGGSGSQWGNNYPSGSGSQWGNNYPSGSSSQWGNNYPSGSGSQWGNNYPSGSGSQWGNNYPSGSGSQWGNNYPSGSGSQWDVHSSSSQICCRDCRRGDVGCLSQCARICEISTTTCSDAGRGAYAAYCQKVCPQRISGRSYGLYSPIKACEGTCAAQVQDLCAHQNCRDYGCVARDCQISAPLMCKMI